MARTISIDPVTRIEGHLSIRVEVESGRVVKAFSSGEMFRGFEMILRGRDPLDAQQITQRICGVCPVSHGVASVLAQDAAYNLRPPKNGRLLRNLILAANYIQSHILHFYHLAALDFVDITAVTKYRGSDPGLSDLKGWVNSQVSANMAVPAAPFLPRYSGGYIKDTQLNILATKHYLDALEMRKIAHEMVAIFGGKAPHIPTLVPGGITERVTAGKIAAYMSRLEKLRDFIQQAYVSDVIEVTKVFPEYFRVGQGPNAFLAFGVFAESDDPSDQFLPSGVLVNDRLQQLDPGAITEDVGHSLFSSQSGLSPAEGQTLPAPDKEDAYSWLKAPRYQGQVMEVGPLARLLVAYHSGQSEVKTALGQTLKRVGKTPRALVSLLGRHAARAVECKLVADRCVEWVNELVPGEAVFADFDIPNTARGIGLTEAPRGALGHWLAIQRGTIANYQCVVPTTWNCSPRDDQGNPGAVEQALVGTPIADPENPIEAARVVRSFDPCIACAVH